VKKRRDGQDWLQRPRFQPLTSPIYKPSLTPGYLFPALRPWVISPPFLLFRQVWLSQSALALLLLYLHSLLLLYEQVHVQYRKQICSQSQAGFAG
jgi:hypothetical protein